MVDTSDPPKPPTDPSELHRYFGDEDWPQTAKTFAERIRAENASLIDQLAGRDRPMRFSPDYSDIDGPHVFVQWKGTDVCLTFHCECGERGHFHGDFAYALRCGACGKEWEMPHSWALVPVHRDSCIQDVEMDPSDDAEPAPPESH